MDSIQTLKKCTRCDIEKPLDAFGKDASKKDGKNSHCRECRSAYTTSDHARKVKAAWLKNGGRELLAQYNQSENGKAANRRSAARYRERYPERVKAVNAVNVAVRYKRMPHVTSLKCALCHAPAEEYHHPDYNEPLTVTPLCCRCHVIVRVNVEQKRTQP